MSKPTGTELAIARAQDLLDILESGDVRLTDATMELANNLIAFLRAYGVVRPTR